MTETTERTERDKLAGNGLFPTVRPSVRLSLFVLSVLSVSSCEETGAKPTTTIVATDSADQVLEGFSHYVTKDGVRRSRVEADTAFFYENTQVTQLKKIRVVF